MSGNENESQTSSRLRDRATSAFQQRREQAQTAVNRASRLRDRAETAFQRRRQQAADAESAVSNRVDSFADALGLDSEFVEPVQLDDRGEEIGFVPTPAGEQQLARNFASERPFVGVDDAIVESNPRSGVTTQVDPGRFDDVAATARQQTAADRQFVEPADIEAEVGVGGVETVGVAPDRQDDIAARQFEATTELADVDPAADVVEQDAGFGLSDSAQRRLGAARIDQQLPDIDVGVDDIEISNGEAVFERRQR